jgi:phosphatidylglycerophosphate synthase
MEPGARSRLDIDKIVIPATARGRRYLGAVSTASEVRLSADVPAAPLTVGFGVVLGGLGLAWRAALIEAGGVVGSVVVFAVGAVLVALHRGSRVLGRANSITLARLVGLAWVTGLTISALLEDLSGPAYGVILVVSAACLVLDGIDGRVARARGEASAFGARFDMEVDAALLMVLCVAVVSQGAVGPWVLLIGMLRYAYWLGSLVVARMRLPLAPRLWRRVVAVVQGVALLVCLTIDATGFGPSWLSDLVAAAALIPLVLSFLTVTVWQLRQPLPLG